MGVLIMMMMGIMFVSFAVFLDFLNDRKEIQLKIEKEKTKQKELDSKSSK